MKPAGTSNIAHSLYGSANVRKRTRQPFSKSNYIKIHDRFQQIAGQKGKSDGTIRKKLDDIAQTNDPKNSLVDASQ